MAPQDIRDGRMPVPYALRTEPIVAAAGIPIRLTMRERKWQRLMRGVLLASSYTDRVDTPELASKTAHRDMAVAKEVVRALSGYCVALDVRKGAKAVISKDYTGLEEAMRGGVEVARRYKIMNPDLLRTDYVKFLYLVQDAVSQPHCAESLGFEVLKPVHTVKNALIALGIPELLEDPRLPQCITPVPAIKSRSSLNRALQYKDHLVKSIVKEYAARSSGTVEDVELVVRSLNDAADFANDNVDSTVKLIDLLREFFSPTAAGDASLAIAEGSQGSRLTHDHTMQFNFVLQSLTLWKNISSRLFELWMTAESDLLSKEHLYQLRNTGQGFHRVQPAPRLFEAVSAVLEATKRELGQWVGSERIHMGDNQVPNAFYFIDKYAQIARIIIPVLRTVASLDDSESADLTRHVHQVYGSVDKAKKAILTDFFRHAFDGSGGDNMEDAGSCIDGRLTSAWNWCNQLRGKPFYPLFLMAGFSSFDGDLSL